MKKFTGKPKINRNTKLVNLRKKNPKKYTYTKLGQIFNISKITARKIYLREIQPKKSKKIQKFGRKPKTDRNKQLVVLRRQNPKKYTFAKLGEIFNINKITAYDIYMREIKRK